MSNKEQPTTPQSPRRRPGPKPGTPPPHIALRQALEETNRRIDRLEGLVAKILPASARALSHAQVKATIEESPMIYLEVLADYRYPGAGVTWKPGHRVRACDYPHLLDLVSGGLKLGVPEGNSKIVQGLLDQARALEENAARSTEAAEAAAAEAKATTAATTAKRETELATEAQENADRISA